MNMYDDDPPTDGMSGSLGAGKNLINSHMSKLNSSQHIYLISNIRMVPGPCWNPGWGALATTAAAVATGAKYLVMLEQEEQQQECFADACHVSLSSSDEVWNKRCGGGSIWGMIMGLRMILEEAPIPPQDPNQKPEAPVIILAMIIITLLYVCVSF